MMSNTSTLGDLQLEEEKKEENKECNLFRCVKIVCKFSLEYFGDAFEQTRIIFKRHMIKRVGKRIDVLKRLNQYNNDILGGYNKRC
jgi:hypothetical protein